jgi:hypothetical protein
MENTHGTKEQQQDPDPAQPAPIAKPDIGPIGPKPTGGTPSHQESDSGQRQRKHPSRFEWVLACIGIVTAFIYWNQLRVMSGQLEQMKGGSAQTDRIIAAAEGIRGSVEAANVQNAKALEQTLAISKSGMESSAVQSKAALDAGIEASRNDQRAWVGPTSFALPECVQDNRPVFIAEGCEGRFGANVVNAGKTIARKYTARVEAAIWPADAPFIPFYEEVGAQSTSVIFPGMSVTNYSGGLMKGFNAAQVDGVKRGSVMVYFFGKLTYQDIFGKSHQTTFCVYVARDLRGLTGCSYYNEAD